MGTGAAGPISIIRFGASPIACHTSNGSRVYVAPLSTRKSNVRWPFGPVTVPALTVNTASETTRNVTLQVVGVQESVTVTGEAMRWATG